MSFKEELKIMSEKGFSQMPEEIANDLLDGIAEVAYSNLKETALQVGDTMPLFRLQDVDGGVKTLETLNAGEYLVIDFYRGGWCPYCNMELREYEKLQSDFKALGANIVAISPEKPEYSFENAVKNAITFDILYDENMELMKEVGLVFKLGEAVQKRYAGFGIDLLATQGNEAYEMPIPATYVINKNREIVFAHVEADYTTRVAPGDVLEFIKEKKYSKN